MTQRTRMPRSKTGRILVCGLIAADIVFLVQQLPRRAEKYRADDVSFRLGGGGAIASVALRKLGVSAHLAGRLGDDVFARLVFDELTKHDIECSRVLQQTGCRSSLSSVFIDATGERQIVNYRNTSSGSNTSSDIANLSLDNLPAVDAVLVDTRWNEAAVAVLQHASKHKIPAVIDAEAPVSHSAMRLATHIAFSRQGLRDYAGSDSIEQGLQQASAQFGNWVCVTDGDQGAYYLKGDSIVQVASFPVVAVDTLGAGDVWHAAFTLQLGRGSCEHDAVLFANAAAALKCSSDKGMDAMPDYATVCSLAAEQGFIEH